MGKRMRTSSVVTFRVSARAPNITVCVIHGARMTPRALSRAATASTRPSIEDARRAGPVAPGPSLSRTSEYTGTKAAERVPSPSRFRMMLGILMAAQYASASRPVPRNAATDTSRARPVIRLRRMPAPTDAAASPGPVLIDKPGSGRPGAVGSTDRPSVTRAELGGLVAARALDQATDELGFLPQALEALGQIPDLGLQFVDP